MNEKTKAAGSLIEAVKTGDWKEALWECIRLYQGTVFTTAGRGKAHAGAVEFTYQLKTSSRTGGVTDELIISAKKHSKSITRSTVELGMENALKEMEEAGKVSGPKKLGVFGASYLYSLFLEWGVISAG